MVTSRLPPEQTASSCAAFHTSAKRAGVTDIILPEDNRQNVLEDLTPEQLQGLTMHYVKSIPEVLEIALPASRAEVQHDAEIREQVLTGAPVA